MAPTLGEARFIVWFSIVHRVEAARARRDAPVDGKAWVDVRD
jgi:hypothetical protein